jgi:hypothetical protein
MQTVVLSSSSHAMAENPADWLIVNKPIRRWQALIELADQTPKRYGLRLASAPKVSIRHICVRAGWLTMAYSSRSCAPRP